MKELEQELGLEAGAVQVERVQMQKARHAEDVLRIARHLSADVSATSETFTCAAHGTMALGCPTM